MDISTNAHTSFLHKTKFGCNTDSTDVDASLLQNNWNILCRYVSLALVGSQQESYSSLWKWSYVKAHVLLSILIPLTQFFFTQCRCVSIALS